MEYKTQKKLLSFNNFKMQKSVKFGYLTAILHLAPYNLSGYNICPKASQGCAMACLNTAGRGQMNCVQKARINKTLYFLKDRQKFLEHLFNEITTYEKLAKSKNLKLAVRLNGTSDLPWERYKFKDNKNLMELFPNVPFYDYTKILNRFNQVLPKNYNLVFSRSESNENEVKELITTDNNIAVVFNKLPKKYLGRRVVTGDESDLRFLDPKKTIIGLLAKGRAKKDNSGFTVIN
jgi:hypothetical protein